MTRPESPRVVAARILPSIDHFRRSPSRMGGEPDYKEWQHFLVFAPGLDVLINFNLIDNVWAPSREEAETPRMIVLVRDQDGWKGDAFRPNEFEAKSGAIDTRFDDCTLQFVDGGYNVEASTPDGRISASLRFVPTAEPAITHNQPLSRTRSLSWLFVPRLVANGVVRVGDRHYKLAGVPAYHDHNWGHFRWGDDFTWEWASALPRDQSNPWSVVYMRLTDRRRTVSRVQGLYLWRAGRAFRTFRNQEVVVTTSGNFNPTRIFRIPRVMGLLSPGRANDIPQVLTATVRQERAVVEMHFEPDDLMQVVMPNETDDCGITVLNEVSGTMHLHGRIGDESVDMVGPGVFEFIRD